MARAAMVVGTLHARSVQEAWNGVQAAWADSVPVASGFALTQSFGDPARPDVSGGILSGNDDVGLLEVSAVDDKPGSFEVRLRLSQQAVGIELDDPNRDAWQEAWLAGRGVQAPHLPPDQLQAELVDAAQAAMSTLGAAIDRWQDTVGTRWMQSLVLRAAVVIEQKRASDQQMGTQRPPETPGTALS